MENPQKKLKSRIRFSFYFHKFNEGFTLVELLIVVVVIGILSATLIPRLTGNMAQTRDIKRQTDLRNIATAIALYQSKHQQSLPKDPPSAETQSKYPWTKSSTEWKKHQLWATKYLKTALAPYINHIPQDPSKNSSLKMLNFWCWKAKVENWIPNCNGVWVEARIEDGDYMYMQIIVGENTYRTLLIAKVETPDAANRVGNWVLWWSLSRKPTSWADQVMKYRCHSIEKSGSTQKATKENSHCLYTSLDELYYVIEV